MAGFAAIPAWEYIAPAVAFVFMITSLSIQRGRYTVGRKVEFTTRDGQILSGEITGYKYWGQKVEVRSTDGRRFELPRNKVRL